MSGRGWSGDLVFEELDDVEASQVYLKRITKKVLSIVLVASHVQRGK